MRTRIVSTVTAAALICLSACSGSDPAPGAQPDTTVNATDTGDVSGDVSLPGGDSTSDIAPTELPGGTSPGEDLAEHWRAGLDETAVVHGDDELRGVAVVTVAHDPVSDDGVGQVEFPDAAAEQRFVVGYDPDTGEQRWQRDMADYAPAPLFSVADDRDDDRRWAVFEVLDDGEFSRVLFIDTLSGDVVAHVDNASSASSGIHVAADHAVIATFPIDAAPSLYSIALPGGDVLWERELRYAIDPVLAGDGVTAIATHDDSGHATGVEVIDTLTGETVLERVNPDDNGEDPGRDLFLHFTRLSDPRTSDTYVLTQNQTITVRSWDDSSVRFTYTPTAVCVSQDLNRVPLEFSGERVTFLCEDGSLTLDMVTGEANAS